MVSHLEVEIPMSFGVRGQMTWRQEPATQVCESAWHPPERGLCSALVHLLGAHTCTHVSD